MEYIYTALLLHKLNQPISEENVKKVISSAGATPDDVRVKALVSALTEVNIDEALKNAAAAQVTAAPATAAPAAGQQAAKPKEQEPAEEKKEEQALEGLSSLFG